MGQVSAAAALVRWEVGAKDAVYRLTITGDITAIDRDAATMTIAGHTVPTSLGNGVRTLSMVHEPQDRDECDRPHADEGNPDECGHEGVDFLISTIETWHIDMHEGAIRFCSHPVCRDSQEVGA